MMKNILVAFFCLISTMVFGQIEGVDYMMKYNCESNQYDVSLVILEGSAHTVAHRAQFNAQISIVVPTGEGIVITNKYMPLQSNQNYDGSAPLDWALGNPVYSPESQPENDFYSVFPKLAPASFYNDLEAGDIVMLFSFVAGTSGQYDEDVRFFVNGTDPDDKSSGMNGADFSNGMSIGGPDQIYNSNIEESCVTSIDEELESETVVYPNPFEDRFTIELPVEVNSITVYGPDGKMYHNSGYRTKGQLTIDAFDFPSGVYYVVIESEKGKSSKKIVKF